MRNEEFVVLESKRLKKKQIVSEDTGKVMVQKNEIEYT